VTRFLLVDEVLGPVRRRAAALNSGRSAGFDRLTRHVWTRRFCRRAEWWLLQRDEGSVAGGCSRVRGRVYPVHGDPPAAISFSRDYVNPWPVHAVVLGPSACVRGGCCVILRQMEVGVTTRVGRRPARPVRCLPYQQLANPTSDLPDILQAIGPT